MTKRLLNTALTTLTLVGISFFALGDPALGDETAPSRSTWKSANLQSEKVVKWVYEGCAAYPVTEEAMSTAATGSKPETDLLDQTALMAHDLGDLDHTEAQ